MSSEQLRLGDMDGSLRSELPERCNGGAKNVCRVKWT